ncbi:class I SAM-dependent methyltransferase [Thermoproteus tenax]|uniref:SAM-dependent methyltransferase n=1 Tax=Thermoproteus tenax (strain ATCC 35583 / DSM 2078 / JCM 9277 / NBRC 100435 / Kra 1) TaxID=768679 RepID=G4RQ03_THETK|nr:class I SAM-dependent methyltransferase [Thermoproteus tenax]CCC81649.1 SAM-dependent methyltransferase [Thermoproteus tenax Kra 1]
MTWIEDFFDEIYRDFMEHYRGPEASYKEAQFLIRKLGIEPGKLFLDAACGHGRHLRYMPEGTVVGLDINLKYLKEAKKYADVVAADLRLPPFRRRAFSGIYIMHSSIGMFGDEEDVEILMWLSGTIKPGGVMALDLANKVKIDRAYAALGDSWNFWISAGPYRILSTATYNPLVGRIKERRIIYRSGEYLGTKTLELRLYSPSEVNLMLRSIGMTIREVYGDFDGSPFSEVSDRYIVIAVKTGGVPEALKAAASWA